MAYLGRLLLAVRRDRAQGESMFLFSVVKSEAASGDCPLQGLLNCLKEIPETPHGRPSPSGVQEDPGAYRRSSGGKGHWPGREGPRTPSISFPHSEQGSTARPSGPGLCM